MCMLRNVLSTCTFAGCARRWKDLTPTWEEPESPIMALNDAQRDDLYVILWGPNYGDSSGKMNDDERKAILEDVKKFNPKCSFPTIIIGEKVIVGFKEKEIKEALGL